MFYGFFCGSEQDAKRFKLQQTRKANRQKVKFFALNGMKYIAINLVKTILPL